MSCSVPHYYYCSVVALRGCENTLASPDDRDGGLGLGVLDGLGHVHGQHPGGGALNMVGVVTRPRPGHREPGGGGIRGDLDIIIMVTWHTWPELGSGREHLDIFIFPISSGCDTNFSFLYHSSG